MIASANKRYVMDEAKLVNVTRLRLQEEALEQALLLLVLITVKNSISTPTERKRFGASV